MNEHIAKLFKQAVSTASGDLHEWNKNWTPGCPNFDYEKVLYEKFAEMIVKECVNIAMENIDCPAPAIEAYFGVEE